MLKNVGYSFVVCVLLLVVSCGKGRPVPNVSSVNVNVNLYPFIFDFLSIPADSIDEYLPLLQEKYPRFLDLYSKGVLHIGSVADEDYKRNLYEFLSYEPNKDVLKKCKEVFSDVDLIQNDLIGAFRFYKYYFPDKVVPDIYLQTSGFNQSVVVDSALMAISLEKYLGENCEFYEWLSHPVYMRKKMNPEKLVPDVIKALGYTEFAYEDSIDDVMSNMYYHARVLYLVKSVLPELNDTLLFDYSAKQLKWANEYEDVSWASLIEQRHLYNTDRMLIQKYTGDTPFTSYFGQDSPPRMAVFIGYKIIEAFMERNKEVSLAKLMLMNNSREVLSKSAYRP